MWILQLCCSQLNLSQVHKNTSKILIIMHQKLPRVRILIIVNVQPEWNAWFIFSDNSDENCHGDDNGDGYRNGDEDDDHGYNNCDDNDGGYDNDDDDDVNIDTHCIQDLPRLAVVALSKGPGGKMHSFNSIIVMILVMAMVFVMVIAMAMVILMAIMIDDDDENHAAML